jgi:uncharacterized protein Usg
MYTDGALNRGCVMNQHNTARDWAHTTVEVFYRIPDFPSVIQIFVWQFYDSKPDFPAVRNFLKFWKRELTEAPIVGVRFGSVNITDATQIRSVGADSIYRLH